MNRPFAGRPIIMELAAREPFRLGNAMIDPVAHEAHWPGGDERLQPQAFKVLMALAAKRGDVVTRDELVELCWDGRIVGDDVINRAISLLRPFAERAGGFSIVTVPRVGYRLIEDSRGNPAKRRRACDCRRCNACSRGGRGPRLFHCPETKPHARGPDRCSPPL